MKRLTTPILTLLTSAVLHLNLSAETMRDWVLHDGNITSASYTEMDGNVVVLTNEKGKSARIPIANLSISDRYYLNKDHDIPIEQLDGGNIYTAEHDLKVDSKSYKKISGIHMKGEGYDVTLEGLLTPHFLVLHEKGAKPLLFAEELERSFFSHAYRHPGHIEHSEGKRYCYLFMKDFKLYTALGAALVAQLREEGTLSNKDINQLEVDWAQYPGHRHWELPAEYQEEYNAVKTVFINFADKKKSDREMQIIGFYNTQWFWFWPHRKFIYSNPPGDTNQNIADKRVSSASFCFLYALAANNDIRTHEYNWHGTGMGLEQTGNNTMGGYGKSKEWASELAKKVKSGDVQTAPVMETFYTAPSNNQQITPPEVYRDFGLLCTAFGRFLEHDVEHMISTAKLSVFMHEQRRVPTIEELPGLYGYSDVEAMNESFKDFIINKNTRMKP